MADVLSQDINQPLKPSRRAFLKAMGAITGTALLPVVAAAELPFIPAVALPPALPPIPEFEPLLAPMSGINNLTVFLNGVMQKEGLDFVQGREGTIEFLGAPCFGDVVINYPTYSVGRVTNGESIIDSRR